MTSEAVDRAVRLFVFERFVETTLPPSVTETSEALAITLAESTAAFDRLASNHVLVLEPGTHEIRIANPLSAVPTPFPVTVGEKSYYAACGWDAFGVVAMLGGTGTIHSSCSCCGETLTLEIDSLKLRPAEAVVHFAVPAAQWWDDIVFT